MKKMKVIIGVLIALLLFPSGVNGQKYSTQEGYEKYFIENYDQLDNIEGIWKKVVKMKFADPNMPSLPETTLNVVIINEGQDKAGNKIFGEYFIENGKYDPTKAKFKFIKYESMPTKYLNIGQKDETYQGTIVYSPFYLRTRTEDFEYTIKMTEKGTSTVLNANIIMFKAFPFEGDVTK